MRKVILTAVIGLLSLMSFAQPGTNYHPNFEFPINYELGEIIYEPSLFGTLDNENFMRTYEAKEINLNDVFVNKGLKILEGIQYFKPEQNFDFSDNPLEDISMLDSMNIGILTMENVGLTKMSFSNFIGLLEVKKNPQLDTICIANKDVLLFPTEKDDHTIIYNLNPDPLSTNNIVSNANELSLFPNPIQNVLSFNGEVTSISIYSVDGVEVYTSSNITNNTVDLSSLVQGKYLVRLVTGDSVISKMIIKE